MMNEFDELAGIAKHCPEQLEAVSDQVRGAMRRAGHLEDLVAMLRPGTVRIQREEDETVISFELRLDGDSARDLLRVVLDLED